MSDPLDEIMARHDAATACGCACCDDDYCAYIERKKPQTSAERQQADTLPNSAASRRRSLRYVFEILLGRQAPANR